MCVHPASSNSSVILAGRPVSVTALMPLPVTVSRPPQSYLCRRYAAGMFERFTDRARRVVALAQEQARELDHAYIGTEHLLLGLIIEGGGVAWKALDQLGVDEDSARLAIKELAHPAGSPSGHIPFSARVRKVLDISLREALQLGHNYIGTEHMLLALVREGAGNGAQALSKTLGGVELHVVRQEVMFLLSGYEAKPVLTPPLLPDPFGPSRDDDADGAATMVISGVLAGEHDKARPVLDALRRLGWRPPGGP